jgi:hypothetical protein
MAMDLIQYEDAVGGVLGFSLDELTWTPEVLDGGVRAALREYEDAAPPAQTEFTVTAPGVAQDLSTIADLRRVAAVAWPWVADALPTRACKWQRFLALSDTDVRFLYCEPAADDVLLVRYWRRFTVNGLDGAVVTNVPAADEYLLTRGAAGYACTIRLRQLSEQPGVNELVMSNLGKVQASFLKEYADGLTALKAGGRHGGVAWGNLGL